MSKPRAIPLAAQVEAAVERAERAETYAAALKKQVGDLTRAHQKDMARIKELEAASKPAAPPPITGYVRYAEYRALKYRQERETFRADKYQAEAEALRKFVPKAGTVVEMHDVKEARAYFVAIVAMVGAALGALVGGLLL